MAKGQPLTVLSSALSLHNDENWHLAQGINRNFVRSSYTNMTMFFRDICMLIYVVNSGDTVSSTAAAYGISAEEII